MGGLASGAFYFASPLAAMGHPAVTRPDIPPVPMIAPVTMRASLGEVGSGGTAADPVLIATVPLAGGLGGFDVLSAAVIQEARRLVKERPNSGSGSPSLPGFGGGGEQVDATTSEDDAAPEPGNLRDAVIAAHAIRIAYLKQRMDALRSDGADRRRLDDLRDRLHRAEAARQLALSRTGADALPVSGCETGACRPGAGATASGGIAAVRSAGLLNPWEMMNVSVAAEPSRRAAARATARSERGGARIAAVSPRTAPGAPHAVAGSTAAPSHHASHPVERIAARSATPHRSADPSGAHRLAQARRALATARSLLEPQADGRAHHIGEPVIAGLWRWAGSERWSLADYRAAAT